MATSIGFAVDSRISRIIYMSTSKLVAIRICVAVFMFIFPDRLQVKSQKAVNLKIVMSTSLGTMSHNGRHFRLKLQVKKDRQDDFCPCIFDRGASSLRNEYAAIALTLEYMSCNGRCDMAMEISCCRQSRHNSRYE